MTRTLKRFRLRRKVRRLNSTTSVKRVGRCEKGPTGCPCLRMSLFFSSASGDFIRHILEGVAEDVESSTGRSFQEVTIGEVLEEPNRGSSGLPKMHQSQLGRDVMRVLPMFTAFRVSKGETSVALTIMVEPIDPGGTFAWAMLSLVFAFFVAWISFSQLEGGISSESKDQGPSVSEKARKGSRMTRSAVRPW